MNTIHFVAAGIVVGFVACYVAYRKRGGQKVRLELGNETFDGVLTLHQVTAFFKSLGLNPKKHKPFIADGDAPDIRNLFAADSLPAAQTGYTILIAGVYEDGKDVVRLGKVFYAKGLDDELQKTLANEKLVVLS